MAYYDIEVVFDEESYKPFGFSAVKKGPGISVAADGPPLHLIPVGQEGDFEAWWRDRGFTFNGELTERIALSLRSEIGIELLVRWGAPGHERIT